MSDVIIIGAGLGGLICGAILSREGKTVTILEQGTAIGGAMQSFSRGRFSFTPGLHYVGSVSSDDLLGRLLDYSGLDGLPWDRTDICEEVVIDGESFMIPVGYDAFKEYLERRFPGEKAGLESYVARIREITGRLETDSIPEAFGQSAGAFLEDTFKDPLIVKVLTGAVLRMDNDLSSLSLYEYARITDSFIRGTYRLAGGPALITGRLAGIIRENGGSIFTGKRVSRIAGSSVFCSDGSEYEAGTIVSDIHPAATVALCEDMRPSYVRRISSLKDSYGVFTVFIGLKPGTVRYINHSISIDREISIHMGVPRSGEFADTVEIMAPVENCPCERDGDYRDWKEKNTERCLSIAESRIPGLREGIEMVFSSSPLTWKQFTGCAGAFGIRKDWKSPLVTVLSPRTPKANLFLTGQSVGLHGMLGVAMSALRTSGTILGKDLYSYI